MRTSETESQGYLKMGSTGNPAISRREKAERVDVYWEDKTFASTYKIVEGKIDATKCLTNRPNEHRMLIIRASIYHL